MQTFAVPDAVDFGKPNIHPMHHRLFVTFDRKKASNSREARQYVADFLRAESFVSSDGRFAHGWADSLLIGGRWSGVLSKSTDSHDIYRPDGYEDDARLLDSEIYERLLKPYLGETLHLGFVDVEDEPLSAKSIGRKWIVVVDYHN